MSNYASGDLSPQQPPWADVFQISAQLYQQWTQEQPASKSSFLAWCLQNKNLKEADYLSWASQAYALPVVKKAFFEQSTVQETWTFGKFTYQWTNEFLPLEEWDGVLRIACIEPPVNFKLDKPFCLVLAPFSELQKTWAQFFPKAVKEVPHFSEPPVELTVELAVAPSQEFNPGDLLKSFAEYQDNQDATQDESANERGNEEPLIMPEGFAALSSTIDIPMPSFSKPSLAPFPEAIPEEIAEAQTLSGFNIPILPPEEPVKAAIVMAGGVTNTDLAVPEFDQCHTLDELAACAFKKMEAHFTHAMFLTCENDQLTPWRWSKMFSSADTSRSPIPLKNPSIFRIVNSTNLPYHGHTKPCEANDLFFKNWLGGRTPAHVTIVPLTTKGHITAMLLGLSDDSADTRSAFSDMEQWAEQSSQVLAKIHSHNAQIAAA